MLISSLCFLRHVCRNVIGTGIHIFCKSFMSSNFVHLLKVTHNQVAIQLHRIL